MTEIDDYYKTDTIGIKYIKRIMTFMNSINKRKENDTTFKSYSFNGITYTHFPKYITIDFNHSTLRVEDFKYENIPNNSLIIPKTQFYGIGFYIQDKNNIYGFNITDKNEITNLVFVSDIYPTDYYAKNAIFEINNKGGSNSKTTKKYNKLNLNTHNNKTKHKKYF